MADDALYQAVKSRNVAATNVRRPIAVVVYRGVRWRAVRPLPRRRVSGKPLRVASPSFVPARTSLQARRLQVLSQDGANVARWLAYKHGYCPPNLSWRIAPFIEPPFGFTTAFSRPPLLRSAGRGMRRAVCRVCPDPPDPFFSRPLRSFIIVFFGAAPRDPGVNPRVGYGL